MVVFDLGGVLVRICRSFGEACERSGVGLRHSAEDFEARRTDWYALVKRFEVNEIDSAKYYAQMSDLFEARYSPAEVERIHAAYLIEAYPGTGELLRQLRAAGMLTGLLSNTNAPHWARLLRDFEAPAQADHPCASHLFGCAKPDASIYRAFRQGVEATGSELLFFDDLPANIEAAKIAGWRAETIDPHGDPARQMATLLADYDVRLK